MSQRVGDKARRGAIIVGIVIRRNDLAQITPLDDRQISPMTEPKRPFVERLELRITMHRVAEFFEELSKLDEPDKGTLFQEISKHLREYMPDAPVNLAAPTSPPHSFVDHCRDLATLAPNERIRDILLKIAYVYEVEAGLEAADNTITTSSDAA